MFGTGQLRNPDMYGVDASKPEGQAYYNSIVKMYADWGDFIKCDDISRPYYDIQKAEIEALRKASLSLPWENRLQ